MITKLRSQIEAADLPTGPHGGRQNLLADSLGINRGRFSNYVTGTRHIPLKHLIPISTAIGCRPIDILGYVRE